MVSKASDDLPEPLGPVKTTSLPRGKDTLTFFKLCCRAPTTTRRSIAIVRDSTNLAPRRVANASWSLFPTLHDGAVAHVRPVDVVLVHGDSARLLLVVGQGDGHGV